MTPAETPSGASARTAHRLGGVQIKRAGEHRQAGERLSANRVEQLVGPLDDPPEAAVTRIDTGPLAGEQGEALVEPGRQRLDADRADPRRRQLDRQRQPVEPAADLGHRPDGTIVQLEPGSRFGGTVDEQLNSGSWASSPVSAAGARSGGEQMDRLAGQPERFPTGGQHGQAEATPAQPLHQGATVSRTCSQLSSSSRTGRSWTNSSIVCSRVRCWRCSTSRRRPRAGPLPPGRARRRAQRWRLG